MMYIQRLLYLPAGFSLHPCALPLVLLWLLYTVPAAWAQDNDPPPDSLSNPATRDLFAAYNVQPEVWHFPGPVDSNVDAGGDLSLAIPILTVPGRGLDFPIVFSYNAGIRVQQRASWLGLGWNFDPGSITRDVHFGAEKPYARPNDPLRDNTTSFESYDVDYAGTDAALPDAYYLHLPSGTFPMTRTGNGSFSIPVVKDQDSRFFTEQWQAWRIEACDTMADTACDTIQQTVTVDGQTTDEPDYEKFVVTTEDGTRYVFAEPTLALAHRDATYLGRHVSTWRLRAMLAADYTGPEIPHDTSPGSWIRFDYRYGYYPALTDTLDYFTTYLSDTDPDILHQLTYLERIVTPTHRAEFTTVNRLDVDMSLEEDYEGVLVNGTQVDAQNLYRNLKRIALKQQDGTLVSGIELLQNDEEDEGFEWLAQSRLGDFLFNVRGEQPCKGLVPGHGTGACNGKTTLNKMVYFDANGPSQGRIPNYEYVFEYAKGDTADNPQYPFVEFSARKQVPGVTMHAWWPWHYMDDYGYYNDAHYPIDPSVTVDQHDSNIDEDDTDAAAWSLTRIIYPTGGSELFQYENDLIYQEPGGTVVTYGIYENRYTLRLNNCQPSCPLDRVDDVTYSFAGAGAPRYQQGGIRVTSITRDNGIGSANTTSFSYSEGRPTGVPGAFWAKDLKTYQEHGSIGSATHLIPASRGASRVVYDAITRTMNDGAAAFSTLTYYTTPEPETGKPTGIPLETVLYHNAAFHRTLAIGNQSWNWGRPWKTEHVDAGGNLVQSVVSDLTFTLHDRTSPHTPFAPVWGYQCANCDNQCPNQQCQHLNAYIDWGYERITRVTTRTFATNGDSGHEKILTENSYHSDLNLVKASKTRRFKPGDSTPYWVGTERTFVYEPHGTTNPGESWYLDHNVLSPVVREDVFEENEANSNKTYYSATITKWDYSNQNAQEPRRPYQIYTWQDTVFGPRPSFDGWDPQDWPNDPRWIKTRTFEAYDQHGHVLTQSDPLGTTTFHYNNTAGFNSAYLTRVERVGTTPSLFMTFDYDLRVGKVNKATDANGNDTNYRYDDLGRPIEVRNDDNELVSTNTYTFADPGSLPTSPNVILTTRHTGTATYLSRQYFDGLARPIQSQTENGHDDLASNLTYDNLGRQGQAWKPYEFDLTGYDTAFPFNTNTFYNGQNGPNSNGRPYIETIYETNPLGRVKKVCAEGSSTTCAENAYGIDEMDTKKYAYVETTDEKNVTTRVTTDALGNTVRTIAGIGGTSSLETRTDMRYDALGNVTTVYPPQAFAQGSNPIPAWATTYSYDTRGQRIRKAAPDVDGDYAYRYDDLGNLRFVRDPIRADPAEDGFLYTRYDLLGRIMEQGLYTGSTSFQSAPVNDITFPTSDVIHVITYVYDSYVHPLPSNVTAVNQRGRLTEVQFDGGYYQYFYDKEGRVSALYVQLNDLSDGKLIAYAYDRQGGVTKLNYERADTAQALELTYSFDAAGRLDQVASKVRTESSATTEARYGYWPTGQVKNLQVGHNPTAIPPIDYTYHIRDWLTQINDLSSPQVEPFELGLTYENNGNVSRMEWATMDNPFEYDTNTGQTTPLIRYSFGYDDINRLTGANFEYNVGGAWADHAAYDVGQSFPILYDLNGNIKGIRRNNDRGAETLIAYTYHTDKNRLNHVAIDTTNYDLDYDANGNLIKTRVADIITYDWRNLPLSTTLPDGNKLTYLYDADGQRLLKRLLDSNNNLIEETFYIRGADGTVLAVYFNDGAGAQLTYWNIVSGGSVVGRIMPPE